MTTKLLPGDIVLYDTSHRFMSDARYIGIVMGGYEVKESIFSYRVLWYLKGKRNEYRPDIYIPETRLQKIGRVIGNDVKVYYGA